LSTGKADSPKTGKLSLFRSGRGNDPLAFALVVINPRPATTSLARRGGSL
jgi:hypothetical protein